jgi:hypothetical protein
MDRFAKNISKETVSEGEIGEEQEEESVDEDDIEDDEEDFEVEEESDPMELQAKTVANATSIWEHYKPRLLTNGARVAYLCSPHPTIIAHSEAHKDPMNNIAVEEFIKRVILPRRQINDPDPNVVLAQLVDKFWAERDDFVKKRGFFSRESIWITASDPTTVSYEWHKRYSLPATEVFGLSACLTCSLVLGCGQAERQWKAMKAQKTGKRTNLGSEKTKKQSVICAAFERQKNETQRKQAQRAGVLWSDEDFQYCKLDEYCQGDITEDIVIEPKRVFHAYLEEWEDMQFNSKGNDVHAARVSAKYEGLGFYDEDHDRTGKFREIDCAVLTKCVRTGPLKTTTQKAGNGLGYFYTVLGTYQGFDKELKLECQSELLYDKFERYWDFYEMVIDYYDKYPDPYLKIVKKDVEEDDGGGKQPAEEGTDESSDDGDDRDDGDSE